jgi:ABC-type multidrug transport system permease subunit
VIGLVTGSFGGIVGLSILQGLTDIDPHPLTPLLWRDISLISLSAMGAGIAISAIFGMINAGLNQTMTH